MDKLLKSTLFAAAGMTLLYISEGAHVDSSVVAKRAETKQYYAIAQSTFPRVDKKDDLWLSQRNIVAYSSKLRTTADNSTYASIKPSILDTKLRR